MTVKYVIHASPDIGAGQIMRCYGLGMRECILVRWHTDADTATRGHAGRDRFIHLRALPDYRGWREQPAVTWTEAQYLEEGVRASRLR